PVVEHGVLTEAIDADRETACRSLDSDEVVDGALGGRLFDPAWARSDARLALEPGERRASDVRQRAGAGLAQYAQPVVARLVVDDESDVDAPRAGIERDLSAHCAGDELGRAREPVVAQARGQPQDKLDGHLSAVARYRGAPGPGEVARPQRRAGV